MESKPIHLSVMSHPENLKSIRSVMSEITLKACLSKEDSGRIILAVDETCSNIIKHSYNNDYTGKIDLTVQLEADLLIISIIDEGIKFDINSIKQRDIHDIKPGGFGMHIIQQVMDSVEYSHTSKGFNKIEMVKKFNN